MIDRHALQKLATALGGLPVLGCRPDSPAAQAGIRYGDIVLMVNGARTADWVQFIEARKLDNEIMEVELFRDGHQVTLTMPLESSAPIDPQSVLADMIAERIAPISPIANALPPMRRAAGAN